MDPEIGTPINEQRYRPDLELLDRYQGYSSEVARLSLLGMAALGFFAVQLPSEQRDPIAGVCLGVAALLFALATACALSHRYHSTDGFYYHLKAARFAEQEPPKTDQALKAAEKRNSIYGHSGKWLGAAVSLFGAGGFFVLAAIARFVFLWARLANSP